MVIPRPAPLFASFTTKTPLLGMIDSANVHTTVSCDFQLHLWRKTTSPLFRKPLLCFFLITHKTNRGYKKIFLLKKGKTKSVEGLLFNRVNRQIIIFLNGHLQRYRR